MASLSFGGAFLLGLACGVFLSGFIAFLMIRNLYRESNIIAYGFIEAIKEFQELVLELVEYEKADCGDGGATDVNGQ